MTDISPEIPTSTESVKINRRQVAQVANELVRYRLALQRIAGNHDGIVAITEMARTALDPSYYQPEDDDVTFIPADNRGDLRWDATIYLTLSASTSQPGA